MLLLGRKPVSLVSRRVSSRMLLRHMFSRSRMVSSVRLRVSSNIRAIAIPRLNAGLASVSEQVLPNRPTDRVSGCSCSRILFQTLAAPNIRGRTRQVGIRIAGTHPVFMFTQDISFGSLAICKDSYTFLLLLNNQLYVCETAIGQGELGAKRSLIKSPHH